MAETNGPEGAVQAVPLRALGARLAAAPLAAVWWLAIGWYALIWALSSRPAGPPSGSLAWSVVSNAVHAPLFGLWAVWLALLAPRRTGEWPAPSPTARAALLGVVALGGLVDEFHQHLWTAGRDFSVLDVASDLVGAAIALHMVEYLGSPRASRSGVFARLGFAALASLAAGALATFAPRCFEGVWWL